jgi:hypothetical protein
MVASEERLPPFVLERSLDTYQRTFIRTKMETPVTYFYTDQPRTVNVRIEMNNGTLTHWFPMVHSFGPPTEKFPTQVPATRPAPKGGSYLEWNGLHLIPTDKPLPPNTPIPALWRVKSNDPWKFARQTDSALIRTFARDRFDTDEYDFEKFLFYRGLGTFDLPLEVKSAEANGGVQLTVRNRGAQPLAGMFAIQVANKTIRLGRIADLGAGESRSLPCESVLGPEIPLDDGVHPAMTKVAEVLTSAGLYRKEAWAMVQSWETSYFRTDGLRILFLIPRPQTDAFIPFQMTPPPTELVRVMVGRTEILTPVLEKLIESWIKDLGASDFRTRDAASKGLARLGRLTEPALRRIVSMSADAEVRNRATTLIRSAVERQ